MNGRVSIAAISYLNTLPFVYGIRHAGNFLHADLILSVPSSGVDLLKNKKADIVLLPVGDLDKVRGVKIISNYCIAAHRNVRTVVLASNTPLEDIQTIYLDSHSSTSCRLVRLLAHEKWNIAPQWQVIDTIKEIEPSKAYSAYLMIGDKVFDYENKFKYVYDLSNEWDDLTSLPFIFAVWVARDDISDAVVEDFNKALHYGVNHRAESLHNTPFNDNYDRSLNYITHNIKYELDIDKSEIISLFFKKSSYDQAEPPSVCAL